jgi:RHS repeat-associated protein
LQHRTEYRYDNRDRRVAVMNARYTGLPVADQKFTSYVYDKVGNMLSITDPVDNTTSYEYDRLNRLIEETNELDKSRTYSYDASGNRTKAIDRNGRVRTFEYDGWNQLIAEKWLDGNSTAIKTISSIYNAGGELTQISDDVSRYSYEYDLRGRLKTVDNAETPGVAPVKFTYEYDDEGNISSVTDAISGVTKVTTLYEYDELDRLTQIRQSGVGVSNKRVDMGYDRIGLLEKIDRFTGLDGTGRVATTNYQYDNLNRLEQIKHQNAANTVLEQLDYGYDVDDRISSIADLDSSVNYDYLADNQLTSADYSNTTPDESYSYDANGNRTNAGYQTGSNNQLSAAGAYIYTYDDEGNLLTQTGNGVARNYVWDYRNRLVGVTDTAGLAVSYGYDVVDQRIAKTASGVTTRHVYDRNHVAMEFENGGAEPTIRYLYGAEVDQILAQDRGNANVSWQMSDQLGSVRLLVGNDSGVRNRYEYDAFGSVTSTIPNGTDDSRYRYTGREWESETGLHYYRARYYDAQVGRFIGQDPVREDSNLYRYVRNRSITYTDPSGMVSEAALALVMRSTRRGTIATYSETFQNYKLALASATSWFYMISSREGRKEFKTMYLPWLLVGPVKDDFGKVALKPFGLKPRGREEPGKLSPTIEFQRDKRATNLYPQGALGVSEVKFLYKDKSKDDGYEPCPDIEPLYEPILHPPQGIQWPDDISLPDFELPDWIIPPIPGRDPAGGPIFF